MTTRYPADLPAVPPHRWGASHQYTHSSEDGEGNIIAQVIWMVMAATSDEAERRVLAVQDYDYQDDLRGARAEAVMESHDLWYVVIHMAPYR